MSEVRDVKVKAAYCKCGAVIECAAMLPWALEDPKWIRAFQRYEGKPNKVEIISGAVSVGYCDLCHPKDVRRKPKSKFTLAESAANPDKVHEVGPMATTRQKAHILLLASDQSINERERSKVVRNIHNISREAADRVHHRLNEIITKRRRSQTNG